MGYCSQTKQLVKRIDEIFLIVKGARLKHGSINVRIKFNPIG